MRISQMIFPRPVVLITTSNGKDNVATFSFVMPISFEPKYVAFAIAKERYTLENLRKTKEFVMNVATKDMLKEVWLCGSRSGRSEDKFSLAKLETEKSEIVKPLRIKKCRIQFECIVEFMQDFGDHFLIVGKVVKEHIKSEKFEPLLHFSGKEFFTAEKIDADLK